MFTHCSPLHSRLMTQSHFASHPEFGTYTTLHANPRSPPALLGTSPPRPKPLFCHPHQRTSHLQDSTNLLTRRILTFGPTRGLVSPALHPAHGPELSLSCSRKLIRRVRWMGALDDCLPFTMAPPFTSTTNSLRLPTAAAWSQSVLSLRISLQSQRSSPRSMCLCCCVMSHRVLFLFSQRRRTRPPNSDGIPSLPSTSMCMHAQCISASVHTRGIRPHSHMPCHVSRSFRRSRTVE